MNKNVFALVLMFIIILTGTSNGNAEIFSDDFNDGVADGWNEFMGSWQVIGGEYVALDSPGDGSASLTGDFSWSSYIYEARVKTNVLDNDFGLIFYAQSTNDYMRFTMGGEAGANVHRISHMVNQDSINELATASFPSLVTDQWYNIKLVLNGNEVSAYIDDQLTVSSTSLPYDHGAIGLISDPNIDSTFDNVTVAVAPEPVSSTLFIIGASTMGFRLYRKKKVAL